MMNQDYCKLGDVATYINGYAFKPSDWGVEGVPIVRIQDLTGNSYQSNYFSGEIDSRYRVHPGDILISWSASLGIFEWQRGDAVLNQHIFKVVFDKKVVDKKFFVHQIRMLLERFANEAHGATMKHLTRPVFNALPFYAPPLALQKKISFILECVSTLIAISQRRLEIMDQLAKSRFIEMFGDPVENPQKWAISCLKSIIEHANNGMTRRGNDESGSIVLRLVELQCGYLDYTAPNRIVLTEQEKTRFLLQSGDFLFARVNGNPENVGRCTYFKGSDEPVYHNDHIIRVRFKTQTISPEYLQHLLNSPYGRNEMRGKIKTSAGQYTINQEGIGSIRIPLPPLALQNEFAAFIEQLDKSKVTIQKSLEKLNHLYKALLQEYFG